MSKHSGLLPSWQYGSPNPYNQQQYQQYQHYGPPQQQIKPDNPFLFIINVILTFFFGYASNFVANWILPGITSNISLTVLTIMIGVPLTLFLIGSQIRIENRQQGALAKWKVYILSFTSGALLSILTGIYSRGDQTQLLAEVALSVFVILVVLVPSCINLLKGQNPLQPGLLRSILAAGVGGCYWNAAFFLYRYIGLVQVTPGQIEGLGPAVVIVGTFLLFFGFLLIPYLMGAIISYLAAGPYGHSGARTFAVLLAGAALTLEIGRPYLNANSPMLAMTLCSAFFMFFLIPFIGSRHAENESGLIGVIVRIWRHMTDW